MPPRKPGSVTAAGVMAIIDGSLGLLCGVCGLLTLALVGILGPDLKELNLNKVAAGGNAQVEAFLDVYTKEMSEIVSREIPWNTLIQLADVIAGLVLSALFLVGGIGLLKMRRWSRKLTLRCCLIGIVVSFLDVVYKLALLYPVTMSAMEDAIAKASQAFPPPPPMPPNFLESQRMSLSFGIITSAAVSAGSVIYLAILVALLMRRNVRSAFANLGQAGIEEQTVSEQSLPRRSAEDDDWQPRASPPPPAKDQGPDWGIKPKE
jgi:hypothetical protein